MMWTVLSGLDKERNWSKYAGRLAEGLSGLRVGKWRSLELKVGLGSV